MTKPYSSSEIEHTHKTLTTKRSLLDKEIEKLTKAIAIDDDIFSSKEKDTDDPNDSDEEQITSYGLTCLQQKEKALVDEAFAKDCIQKKMNALQAEFNTNMDKLKDDMAKVNHKFFGKINFFDQQIEIQKKKYEDSQKNSEKKSSKRSAVYLKNCSRLKFAKKELEEVRSKMADIDKQEEPLMLEKLRKESEAKKALALEASEAKKEEAKASQKAVEEALQKKKEAKWALEKEKASQKVVEKSFHLRNIQEIKTLSELLAYDDKYMDDTDYLTEEERVIFKEIETTLENAELPPETNSVEQIGEPFKVRFNFEPPPPQEPDRPRIIMTTKRSTTPTSKAPAPAPLRLSHNPRF